MTLFALLVGIDTYRSPVAALRGCVNDVAAMRRLLVDRGSGGLSVRVLVNEEATRDAVVGGFREHLGQAGVGDVALFYYAGHGSQEPAEPYYRYVEPDLLNETLVLFDSRQADGSDLADKELAALVAEVAAGGGHVVVILDCCHSGSGTRVAGEAGMAVRRAAADQRARSAESYVGGWRAVPDPPHVLLAACRADQTAKEGIHNGLVRGAFTAVLLRVLGDLAADLTYFELIRWVAAGLRARVPDQTPLLETGGGFDAATSFLGWTHRRAGLRYTASFLGRRGWVLDAGLVHGIADRAATLGDTEVGLFALAGHEVVARAKVSWVEVTQAGLDVQGAVDEAVTYRAELVRVPQPAATVAVKGCDRAAARLANVAEVRLVGDPEAAVLRVEQIGGMLSLVRPAAQRPVIYSNAIGDESTLDELVSTVVHVARWFTIADRRSSAQAEGIEAATLELISVDGTPVERRPEGVYAHYRLVEGQRVQPTVRIRITNGSQRRWFYALVALSEAYGVKSLLPGGGIWLDSGAQAWVLTAGNLPVWYLSTPPEQSRAVDVFRLIVSSEQFDARQWDQPDLGPAQPGRNPVRDLDDATGDPIDVAGWLIADTVIVTEREPVSAEAGRP